MRSELRCSLWLLATLILLTLLTVPQSVRAQQQHVVSPAEIHRELVNATQTRRQNREKVRELFASEKVQKALQAAGLDPGQVNSGVSTLTDAELARLAARAELVRADFAAGRLSDRDILIIILGIAALILIIVAVD